MSGNARRKRTVLRCLLDVAVFVICCTWSWRVFHAEGPAQEKPRSTNLMRVFGSLESDNLLVLAERRPAHYMYIRSSAAALWVMSNSTNTTLLGDKFNKIALQKHSDSRLRKHGSNNNSRFILRRVIIRNLQCAGVLRWWEGLKIISPRIHKNHHFNIKTPHPGVQP